MAPMKAANGGAVPERDRGGVGDGLTPYRRLAMHVLVRALLDLSNPAASPGDRESARRFLTGSPMLFHWCRVAAVDPRLVARHMATHPLRWAVPLLTTP